MKDRRLIVGIDLGTTHCVVAWARPSGKAEVFAVRQLVARGQIDARPLLPSTLYAPLPGELTQTPHDEPPWVVGELARQRGSEVPARHVSSAKSWLSHPGVDRDRPILPWGLGEDEADLPRVSPVEASARYLLHLRGAWDEAHPDHPLAEQDIILTVPASFDEVARELTVLAATRAGLSVRLLEEPQAAFYDYMQRVGAAGLGALIDAAGGEAQVLVCDVGGGTTDLSLIRVARGDAGGVDVSRVAVGSHLLLGGDNMDLALAHRIEPRLGGDTLDARGFAQLTLACRAAKERLLGADAPDEATVTVLGSGSRLIGSARSARLSRAEVESVVLDGFFPAEPLSAKPRRGRGALVALGLPYEADPALTRHLAAFVLRHCPAGVTPSALLLNGGVFRASRIASRLSEVVASWGGAPVPCLDHGDPDLAVARGAVAYGLALRGEGVRIGGGSARGYFIGLGAAGDGARQGVCVVPRGAEEGRRFVLADHTFALTVGRPVRFDLYSSDDLADAPAGAVVTLDDERFQALPPLTATLRAEGRQREVTVVLEGELSAVGTLDIACVERAPAEERARRHRLAFELREPDPRRGSGAPPSVAPPSGSLPPSRSLADALAAIARAFPPKGGDADPREAKGLLRELERLLGERSAWTTETARALFDALGPGLRARRLSADHERVFWLLAGFCLRPGFGHPLDEARVRRLAPALRERLAFPEARVWQQLWIAGRRVAPGLSGADQEATRDLLDPFFAPAEAKLKRPKGYRPESRTELLDFVASLERVEPARRSELGGWLLEQTWTESDPGLWPAIGKLGARIPSYASLDHVVPLRAAERWVDHLLRERWAEIPSAIPTAVRLTRRTGDRARDVSDALRAEVLRRLEAAGASEADLRVVREVVATDESDRIAFFGDSLPVGLRLLRAPGEAEAEVR